MNRNLLALPALAWLCTASLSCAPAGPESAAATGDETADSAVVAWIADAPVTQAELDEWIRDELFEREVISKSDAEQYELRSSALEELVTRRAAEAEAARLGISREDLLQQKVDAFDPVTDEDIRAFFERHRARFRPGDALEQRGPQIRSYLESERAAEALVALRDSASVRIVLEPPRTEVAATGPSRGPQGAPVTIIEFSDYQCPYCSRAEPTVQEVLERYPDRVRLVFRHLPLDSIHPQARGAAEAAACAEQQGRFWDFHEQLFANQRALGADALRGYAEGLGLDLAAYDECVADPEVKARVQTDVDEANALGIRSTPAFFVNGIRLSGAKPIGDFVRVIERELAGGMSLAPEG
ncbi:MAG: thioredoxin domain-containing protein [Proteobacteria bacterium]|nr:thioredoxin domain-containing protein [Pseudomonadota bacterium]